MTDTPIIDSTIREFVARERDVAMTDKVEVERTPGELADALKRLSNYLSKHHGMADEMWCVDDAARRLREMPDGERCTCPRFSSCPVHGDGGATNAQMIDMDI